MNRFFLLAFFGFAFAAAKAQTPATEQITFRGTVYDAGDSSARPAPMVVDKRTGTGQAFMAGGTFSISGLKTDTFLVTSGGYEIARYCFRDSAAKPVYTVRVPLHVKQNYLNPVAIYPVKDLSVIKQERESLHVEQTYTTQGLADAMESPITYMYERFSREGRSRATVAEMENKDKQADILKDLFRTYNAAGVIDLKENEFDAFIAYLNLPEEYLRTASDYDLAVTIRQRYLQYRAAQEMHNSNQR